MVRIVYKLRPAPYWRIPEHESWFSDMAAKGCHLKKVGLHFAKFVKGEPKNTRYRIEASSRKRMEPEQIQENSEKGWEYVDGYQYFHVFSSPAEFNALELHQDPLEYSSQLKEVESQLSAKASISFFGLFLMMLLIASFWFIDGTPMLVLIEGVVIPQTVLTLFIANTTLNLQRAASSISALRRDLSDGKPIGHVAPEKKHHRLSAITAFIFTLIIGLSAILPIIQLVENEASTLPETSENLPIVRLAEVDQTPGLVRTEPSDFDEEIDWGNYYSVQWSPLAPVQYEAYESGVISGELWKDDSGDGEYLPTIHSRVFQLRPPGMSDRLMADLMKRYSYSSSEKNYAEINHPDVDSLVIHEEGDLKEVFASKGKTVLYVQYFGRAEMEDIIEQSIGKVLQFQ
ncbi:membrane protein [Mesobacillus campisalis]|uniref:Membrane protein n=1 Tax=Mesobacillus campisalis TaxID=1408103 RepID=A0A0M2T1G2_9BACI|nr:DUF2812 domain-containing protein [Mesobacillus campisalis]KKK39067.1 membrane protein [Mesobacillus campisalis]